MRRLFVVVLILIGAGILQVVPAQAGSDETVDRIYQLRASGLVTFTEDGRTVASDLVGDEVVVDLLGNVVDRIPFHAKAATDAIKPLGMPAAPCVHNSEQPGFTAHIPPIDYPIDKKNEKGAFKFHFYSQDNARRDEWGAPTVQFLGCGVGGVDGQNGSRIRVSGPGMAFNDANASNIIGTRWREGKTTEDYSVTLGFEVPVRAVTVKGSIQQDPSNYLKGSVVPPYGGWDEMERLHRNAVNAWGEDGCRPRCTRWGGSNNYQGSAKASGSSLSGTSVTPGPGDGGSPATSSTIAATPLAADMAAFGMEGRVTIVLRTLATAAAVTLLVGGCSAKVSRETGSKNVDLNDLVAVEGPAPVGRFYVKAGENSLDADL